ncbi:hypothetical protein [Pseudodesulfovibrio sp.]|uniref:hypothetical protein n=1 Tax=Pseudodesulfovibrio sp. TaxID=2035812 RepID=UPI0026286C86|nr:hypothetical protein [Pseudodesulfovibrio sp.]MDD3313210.1 hypothetical protein [Pseudodesulfovibrio sp.]
MVTRSNHALCRIAADHPPFPLFFLVLLLILLPTDPAMAQGPPSPHLGTFSSLFRNGDGVRGFEIKLAAAAEAAWAICQRADGEPGQLEIVKPIFEGDRITFVLRDGTKWVGRYLDTGIELIEPAGYPFPFLKRQPSYWDEPRDRPPKRP